MSRYEIMPAVSQCRSGDARRRRAALLAALLGLVVAGAQAQEEAAKDMAAPSAQESRQVDESEESFRARMELREQRLREQQRGTPTFSYSTSQDGKLANLPPESQEHIRAQLRDMVIESRTWKPGEDLSGYPYEPSPGAAKDPGLARQEREAFIEQLEKYQQREAAHAAAPSGSPGESGEPAEGEGSAAPGSTAVATAGVTESALDFLKQQGMAGNSAAAAPEDGTGEGEAGEQEAAAEDAASPQADETGEGSAREQQQEAAPAGTVAIAELASLDQVLANGTSAAESAQQNQNQAQSQDQNQEQSQDQDQQQSRNEGESEAGMTMRDVPEAEPEPGTVGVEALQRLDPALVGARNGDEDGR